MRHSKGTVQAVAVAESHLILRRRDILVVASLAEIVSSIAEVNRNTAAEHALPIDMLGAMFFASLLARSQSLQLAIFAQQIFLRCRLLYALLYLAIDHASEVGFGTIVALVERAGMHRQSLHFAIVSTVRACESLILV